MFPPERAAGPPKDDGLIDEPEVSWVTLEGVTLYTATLAVAARRASFAPEVLEREALFADLGCAACPTPELETGEPPDGNAVLKHQRIPPTPTCSATIWSPSWPTGGPRATPRAPSDAHHQVATSQVSTRTTVNGSSAPDAWGDASRRGTRGSRGEDTEGLKREQVDEHEDQGLQLLALISGKEGDDNLPRVSLGRPFGPLAPIGRVRPLGAPISRGWAGPGQTMHRPLHGHRRRRDTRDIRALEALSPAATGIPHPSKAMVPFPKLTRRHRPSPDEGRRIGLGA
ncbi:MAG: hypothetical protein JXX28_02790 [Deltaproteobacteria bacterium]|nr:hypothetical protein [Deltaproteobacteria bacterium]